MTQFWKIFEKIHVYTHWLKSICKIRYFQIFPKKSVNTSFYPLYFIQKNPRKLMWTSQVKVKMNLMEKYQIYRWTN